MAKKQHKDVEFAVNDGSGHQRTFKNYDEAAGFAVSMAMSRGSSKLDILVYSKAGAKHVGGSDGVTSYNEDPDASVFERIEIKVNHVGRVA